MTSHTSTTSSRNELMRPPGYEDARHNYAPGSAGVKFAMRHPKYTTCPHFSLLRDGENDPWPLERIIDLSAWSATGQESKKRRKAEETAGAERGVAHTGARRASRPHHETGRMTEPW